MTGGTGGFIDAGGWRALFVVFDDQGIVLEAKFVHLSGRKSLDDQLEDWAHRIRRKRGIERTAAR